MSKLISVYVQKQLRIDRLTIPQKEMYRLGEAAVKSVTDRLKRGVDDRDRPLPALSTAYSRLKKNTVGNEDRNFQWGYRRSKVAPKGKNGKRLRDKYGRLVPAKRSGELERVGADQQLLSGLKVRRVSDNYAEAYHSTAFARKKANLIDSRMKKKFGMKVIAFSGRDSDKIISEASKVVARLAGKIVRSE